MAYVGNSTQQLSPALRQQFFIKLPLVSLGIPTCNKRNNFVLVSFWIFIYTLIPIATPNTNSQFTIW